MRPATFAEGNATLLEPLAAKMEMDQRRHWMQSQNLQRVVRKNRAYKEYLVDKM